MRMLGRKSSLALLTAALVVAVPALPASAKVSNPGVVDVKDSVHGLSYEEWSAAWWQWVFDTPADAGPFGEGPVDCSVNQPDPEVLFLAGPFNVSGDIPRECTDPITTETFIFFPVVNVECSSIEDPPFFGGTPQARRRCARSFQFADLQASVDGTAIATLKHYEVTSPDFAFAAIEGNPGIVPGEGFSTSNGVWVMLEPLPSGTHTITFSASVPEFDFTLHMTYVITVA